MPQERIGCLGALLRLFGLRFPFTESLPYRIRDDFLSKAELSFYRTLMLVVKDKLAVSPKVGLEEIFYVPRGEGRQSYRNRIDRKHIDFLLCDPITMKPLLGIELDDSSHNKPTRIERDKFVDSVFKRAGLPLLRIPARKNYEPNQLLELISPHLANRNPNTPTSDGLAKNRHGKPICRKCGVEMIERVAERGPHAGRKFWGCVNYPKCRETA